MENSIFFQEKNQNLVKVILIRGISHDVTETKKKVYQKYKDYFSHESFHLQHVSESYDVISMLCAHQTIMSFQELIESFRETISLQKIKEIVKDVVNGVLRKENFTRICSNVDSSSDIQHTKRELLDKTMGHIESEICAELQRHMELEIKMNVGPVLCYFPINRESNNMSEILQIFFRVLIVVNTFSVRNFFEFVLRSLDTSGNSSLQQKNVVDEVYVMMLKKKENILEELSKQINQKCETTSDHLKAVWEQLEYFRSRIDAIDRRTREYLLKVE